jgi:hypothetical protein
LVSYLNSKQVVTGAAVNDINASINQLVGGMLNRWVVHVPASAPTHTGQDFLISVKENDVK